MRARIFSVALVLAMLVTQSAIGLAQSSTSGWVAVQAVPVNDLLTIKLKDGKTIQGDMIEANDTNLSISRDNKVTNVARADIGTVWHSKGKASKTKWALIGTGIGAAAGAGIGAAKASGTSDDGEIYILVGTVFGAGIGAVSGAVFGATRRSRELIYYTP